mgnify:CR=1 FL=1
MREVRLTRYGRERTYVYVTCDTCGREFTKRKNFISDEKKNFCNTVCRAEYSEKLHGTASPDLKKCRKCGKTKSVGEFYARNLSKDKVTPDCKDCVKQARKEKYGSLTSYRAQRREATQRINRASSMRRKYGLSLQDYEDLLEQQGKVCAICGSPERRRMNGIVIPLSVDHCHETNKIRGLLCNDCNAGIAMLREDAEILRAAISYLERV